MSHAAVRPFDLALARRLLALDGPGLRGWLDGALGGLKARTRRGVLAWLEAVRTELPPEQVGALPPAEALVAHWDDLSAQLDEAQGPAEVALAAAAIAEKAAFGEERVALGAASALSAVFGVGAPDGALSSRTLFPTDGEERYLLLLPEHVDALAAALGRSPDGSRDLATAAALAALASRCRTEPGLRVAYLHGF
jgi:hypothetical protein